jgi:hypothetical protein
VLYVSRDLSRPTIMRVNPYSDNGTALDDNAYHVVLGILKR